MLEPAHFLRFGVGRVVARQLGAMLGPVVGAPTLCGLRVKRVKCLAGMDALRFQMSRTEALTQAMRSAHCHTGRQRLVRFVGDEDGWWVNERSCPANPCSAATTSW